MGQSGLMMFTVRYIHAKIRIVHGYATGGRGERVAKCKRTGRGTYPSFHQLPQPAVQFACLPFQFTAATTVAAHEPDDEACLHAQHHQECRREQDEQEVV
ncbi:MAG: hypothetical protein EGQ20_18540 [Bacteroides oleiciplenus]|nr:hypothetical protein [Bacteroides oleiciplenus]